MDLTNKKALSKVRLEHAKDALEEAKALLDIEKYKGAANIMQYFMQCVQC